MFQKIKAYIVFSSLLTSFFSLCLIACNDKDSNKASVTDPVFKKISSSQSGITFNNLVDENYQKNFFDKFAYVYNGGGVGIGDFNNDGLQDMYFTGNDVLNKLYINEGGFKFKDVTATAGVDGGKGWDNGVTIVDIKQVCSFSFCFAIATFTHIDILPTVIINVNNCDTIIPTFAAIYTGSNCYIFKLKSSFVYV